MVEQCVAMKFGLDCLLINDSIVFFIHILVCLFLTIITQ